jgi:transposase
MLFLRDTPVSRAAEMLRCNEKSLTKTLRYYVNDSVDKMDLSDVQSLAIDETSFKRGHKYVTVVIDADERRVVDVEEGRDKEAVAKFADKFQKKGGNAEEVTSVTSDMSTSYMPAIKELFPNASNVVDKFHVKKLLIDALDTIRKEEQKASADKKSLFQGRRLFMIPESKLTPEQAAKIGQMSKLYPKTGKAYRIISVFDDFYKSTSIEEADASFSKLVSWMRRCRLEPMKKAAETLKRHKDNILAYFKDHLTNAISEGINSIIQVAKRKARGFRTIEGFKAMIYLVAGKLDLDVPHPFNVT